MKKLMICVLAMLLSLSACQKPYTTTIDLGVNHEEIILPSSQAGHCFITVFSNGSWTIKVSAEEAWVRLDRSGGEGIAYPRLDYDENLGTEQRLATVVVEGQGKKCEIKITQPAE